MRHLPTFWLIKCHFSSHSVCVCACVCCKSGRCSASRSSRLVPISPIWHTLFPPYINGCISSCSEKTLSLSRLSRLCAPRVRSGVSFLGRRGLARGSAYLTSSSEISQTSSSRSEIRNMPPPALPPPHYRPPLPPLYPTPQHPPLNPLLIQIIRRRR